MFLNRSGHGREHLGLGELLFELIHGLRQRILVFILEIVVAGSPRPSPASPSAHGWSLAISQSSHFQSSVLRETE